MKDSEFPQKYKSKIFGEPYVEKETYAITNDWIVFKNNWEENNKSTYYNNDYRNSALIKPLRDLVKYYMLGPTGLLDGETYQAMTKSFDSYIALYEFIEKDKNIILYDVSYKPSLPNVKYIYDMPVPKVDEHWYGDFTESCFILRHGVKKDA